ncbi:uncharacterized protein [Diadema setosum]|uniref:uncharacterized protein n=1 Tax=Diadema setosum TaxID=31175 RepID=UPI003B3B1FB8
MATPIYEALANSSVSWQCVACGMPQFSTSLFDSHITNTWNSFESLHSISEDNSNEPGSPGPPRASSSPLPQRRAVKKTNLSTSVKIVTVNFQSVNNKKEEIANLIDSTAPGIIIGTETWLNDSIHTSEILPSTYDVFRKDRADGYGGVLIAINKRYTCEHIPSRSECEALFTELPLRGNKTLIVGALYRPPSSSLQYTDDLCNEIENLCNKHKNAVFWLGGDLNLPDIKWDTQAVEGNQYIHAISNRFLEMIGNCGLQQMVTFPTRHNKTLDLFLSNRPSLVNRCTAHPGISDHDIVVVDSDVSPKRRKPVKRKLHLWKNADLRNMKNDCVVFQKNFIENFSLTSPVPEMWSEIKQFLLQLLDKHVPSKMTSTRFNQPSITTSVKRLTRRKKRSFVRARKSQKQDFLEYLNLKKQTRIACKEAYNNYLTDIVSPESKSNPKRFWSFINSKRCERTGVAPLKSP